MADNVVRLPSIRNALAVMARMQEAGHFLRDPEPGGADELDAASEVEDDGLWLPEPDMEFWAAGEDDEQWIEEALAYAERAEVGRAVLRREMAGDRVVALAAWRALRRG
ncbi:hypothetical protein [Niveispirillum lacus]|nr:hypothetical protein [Niveispirillum lacus]